MCKERMLLQEDASSCFLWEKIPIIHNLWYPYECFLQKCDQNCAPPSHSKFGWCLYLETHKYPSSLQVSEVYSKELKGAISALASLQGHLLIASGPKIILHKWNGTELNGIAFFDAPPLHVVSLNIVSDCSLNLFITMNKWPLKNIFNVLRFLLLN